MLSLGRTAGVVAGTPSAREEGIDDDLRSFANAMQNWQRAVQRGEDGQDAVVIMGLTSNSVKDVCGFGMFGEP